MSGQCAGQSFDAAHGVVTEAMLFLGELDGETIGEAIMHATHYEPVPIADFDTMIAELPDDVIRTSTFIDIGSGMGRAVFLAMRSPFKHIFGIEVSGALHETAKENLAQLRGIHVQCHDVRLVRADARHFEYPSGDLVLFLYNPFDAEALHRTLTRVNSCHPEEPAVCHPEEPAQQASRRTYLLYHTPEHLAVAEALGYRVLRVAENVAIALAVDVE